MDTIITVGKGGQKGNQNVCTFREPCWWPVDCRVPQKEEQPSLVAVTITCPRTGTWSVCSSALAQHLSHAQVNFWVDGCIKCMESRAATSGEKKPHGQTTSISYMFVEPADGSARALSSVGYWVPTLELGSLGKLAPPQKKYTAEASESEAGQPVTLNTKYFCCKCEFCK